MGLPWDTRASIESLIAFACELDPDIVEFFYPYPFPGTLFQRQCIELGLLAPGEIPKQSYAYPAIATTTLSKEELAAYRTVALRPSTFGRARSRARCSPPGRLGSSGTIFVSAGRSFANSLRRQRFPPRSP